MHLLVVFLVTNHQCMVMNHFKKGDKFIGKTYLKI